MAYVTKWSTKFALLVMLLFSVFVEVVILPIILGEIVGAFPEVKSYVTPAFIGAVLVILCGQAMIIICWILTSMVHNDRIFSRQALRLVTALTALPFVSTGLLGIVFISLNMLGFTQPGIMYLIIGALALASTVGFILLTLRSLLVRTITLHTELSEVI